MPKTPNPIIQVKMLQKEIAQMRYDMQLMKGVTIQQCIDFSKIALNQGFSFGPKMNKEYEELFRKTFVDFSGLSVDDAKDDQEIVYTKATLDRRLRQAAGDDIPPFDERYDRKNLYFRDSMEKWKDGETGAS